MVRDLCRHNRDDAWSVFELGTAIEANAAACDNFVGFELGFVNMHFDALVWCDSHQMIAKRAAGFFRGDDMFEFYALESRVFGPGDIPEQNRFVGKPKLAIVEFFEKIVAEKGFFHDLTPLFVIHSRLLLTVSRLCSKSIRRRGWKNWIKLRKFGDEIKL